MYSIGIDFGGTSIKGGIVDENGKIICKKAVKTAQSVEECIESIVVLINGLLSDNSLSINEIRGIGFGFPGTVSSKKGRVDFLPNVCGWENVDFVNRIKKYFATNVVLSNDANVATLAEVKFGSAKGALNAVMLTLGTGVGGGVVIDGKLYEGEDSKGTELGHTTLIFGGKQCACGRKGCLETYVSATALIESAKTAMKGQPQSLLWEACENDSKKLNGISFFMALNKGDATAEKVFEKYIEYLGEGVLNFCNIFRPEVIVLGGGISAQGKVITDKVKKYCEKFHYGIKGAPKVEIVAATLFNDAGIIGASALV